MNYDFYLNNLNASNIKCGALVLPTLDAASGALVVTNGSGVLTLVVPSFSSGPASSTNNAITTFNGTTGKLIQSSGAT